MAGGAERKDAFLRAALLLIAPGATKGRVEAEFVERLLQSLSLPHVGVERAVIERVDPARGGLGVLVHEQFHFTLDRHPISQAVHFLEFPGRIHVEQREGRR